MIVSLKFSEIHALFTMTRNDSAITEFVIKAGKYLDVVYLFNNISNNHDTGIGH